MKKQLALLVVTSAALNVNTLPVHADGPINLGQGAFGPNRRVRTPANGYIGVRGRFSVPEYSIPIEFSKGTNGQPDPFRPKYNTHLTRYTKLQGTYSVVTFYADTAKNQGWQAESSPTSNPFDDKPSFYLGARAEDNQGNGQNEVDCGIQLEWMPYFGAPPGWSGIFSRTRVGYLQRFTGVTVPNPDPNKDPIPYRAGPGTPNSGVEYFDLTYTVTSNGQSHLKIDTNATSGSSQVNTNPNVPIADESTENTALYFPNDQRAILRMKRVVCITQENPANVPGPAAAKAHVRGFYALDNSHMRGCFFTDGMVRTNAGAWTSWANSAHVDNTANNTGYAPGLLPPYSIYEKDNGSPRTFMVNFPILTALAQSAGVTNEATIRSQWHNAPRDHTRYGDETVSINLHTGTSIKGSPLEPGWAGGGIVEDIFK